MDDLTPSLALFVACALCGVAIPMPEDLAVLYAGIQLQGGIGTVHGLLLAAVAGVLTRDALFFGIGRGLGAGALKLPLLVRVVGDARIASTRAMVDANGGRAILLARGMIGARSVAFLTAGALGVRVRDFLFWDLVGLGVTVPVALGLGYLVGEPATALLERVVARPWLMVGLGAILLAAWATSALGQHMQQPTPARP